ncbi:hypothetical protein D5366_08380 [Neokomagataea tanensis]|uniref:Uncharacterized protein n=2 Tax=Neokomagataea TaxID=1223423 RepID=A0A4Y6V9V7_9PROT|nr:hypothetical protein [Neokomagataea tanensis]QDH25227.1 hypothetical protein D5366_08380 [Neokomagataea tanensis]
MIGLSDSDISLVYDNMSNKNKIIKTYKNKNKAFREFFAYSLLRGSEIIPDNISLVDKNEYIYFL